MANESILEVLEAAVDALHAGQRAALLTVVRAIGSTPRGAGAKMLLRDNGTLVGTIGGGTLEERAVADAQQAMAGGYSTLKRYEFSTTGSDSVGLCGGAVDVSIEVLAPPLRLVIIGAGHIAQALAQIAAAVGMEIIIVDDRPEWASKDRFPMAHTIHIVAYDRATETLQPLPVQITPATAVVLATWGWDEPALRQIIGTPAFYIGLVASRRKLKFIFDNLGKQGIDPALIERVHAPAGLDLGGETPGEIALSIMAEIQLVRHAASGQPLTTRQRQQGGSSPPSGQNIPSQQG